jgi:hypothetical protein
MEIESLRRKNGEAPYKTSPKSDVELQKLNMKGGERNGNLSEMWRERKDNLRSL